MDIIRKSIFFHGSQYNSTHIKNLYASSNGDVVRISTNGNIIPLQQFETNGGYMKIKTLYGYQSVHKLVYDAWGSELLDNSKVIDHLDSIRNHNNISNLRQCTQKENMNHAISRGVYEFGSQGKKPIKVYDSTTGITKKYESVKDFMKDINAPAYIIRNGGVNKLKKRREYDRYSVTYL